jgi:hypothetical protein
LHFAKKLRDYLDDNDFVIREALAADDFFRMGMVLACDALKHSSDRLLRAQTGMDRKAELEE